MSTIQEEIGARIRAIRSELKLTQAEFGDKLNASKSSISCYESGAHDTSPAFLIKLSELSGKSLEWLMSGKEADTESKKNVFISYSLAEDEKNALTTAESIIERFGLDKRFQVTEIHHSAAQSEIISKDEKQLLKAFRQLDHRRQERLIEDAEDMVLARKESHEKGLRAGGLMDLNCA